MKLPFDWVLAGLGIALVSSVLAAPMLRFVVSPETTIVVHDPEVLACGVTEPPYVLDLDGDEIPLVRADHAPSTNTLHIWPWEPYRIYCNGFEP